MIDFIREPPGLSRRKQGFETPTGRQLFQGLPFGERAACLTRTNNRANILAVAEASSEASPSSPNLLERVLINPATVARADVIALDDLLPHHLAIDQLEGLGRDADLAPKWMVEQDDQANHCTGEERDKPTQ